MDSAVETAAQSVSISGKEYQIVRTLSANRTACARLKEGAIVISIPARWPKAEKDRVSSNLLGRAIKAIERGRWRQENAGKVVFSHGQRVMALGRPLEIVFVPSKRFRSRLVENRVEVGFIENHPDRETIAARHAKRRIMEEALPRLIEEVRKLNDEHFQAAVPKVSLRDNTSRWGSCSADGSISLNFRLLFMPPDILRYVIVHELAHTRYRSHGPRFWALVEKIIPDHKEKRRWLRDNGWSAPDKNTAGGLAPPPNGQLSLDDFSDEPY
ncbi:MAG: M48 family metallopeptidase [Candidatus Micrarchaeota archaeon]